ncbi:MAG TPA: DUF1330 domain-containing protein [Pyrinomonadaceae bacterium]
MAAYVIVEIDVFDQGKFDEYKPMVPPTVAAYGGKFLVRGGAVETLEGDWAPARIVVLEFENAERAKQWWDSAEYSEAKNLRQSAARTQMILVEGQ